MLLSRLGALKVALQGERLNVMHEFFATTADVYRLTGELDPEHDLHPAADGALRILADLRIGDENHILIVTAMTPVDDFVTRVHTVVCFRSRLPGALIGSAVMLVLCWVVTLSLPTQRAAALPSTPAKPA